MRTRVKICCVADRAEAAMAARAGADLIGLVGPMPSGPGTITLQAAAEIADTAPAWATPILLSASETAEDIATDICLARVRAVQIVRHVDPDVHTDLARVLPAVRRIQVVHVEGAEALDLIPAYADGADAFLLDSGRVSADRLGGTGQTHDWSISARFVERSPIPVFLAGGLTPGNAAQALATVRPFGLDVCSGLRTDGQLDPAKLSAFMAAVEDMA